MQINKNIHHLHIQDTCGSIVNCGFMSALNKFPVYDAVCYSSQLKVNQNAILKFNNSCHMYDKMFGIVQTLKYAFISKCL